MKRLLWTIPFCILAPVSQGSTLYQDTVKTSTDDAYYRSDATWNITTVYYLLGRDASAKSFYGGTMFDGVTIDQGSTIDSAFIIFVAQADRSGAGCNIRFYCEDTSSAATFSTSADFLARIKTNAYMDWSGIAAWTTGNSYQSVDIKDPVQEIVNRGDWSSDNNLVVFTDDNASSTSGQRNARSWDYNGVANAPIIQIYYSAPGSATAYPGSYDQGTNWTNPTNATGAPDNSCATYDNGNQDILTLYNFSFSISTDATIDSINIDFDGYGTQSQVARRDLEVQLTKTGGGANTGVGDLLENVRMIEGANCAASGVYNITGQLLWNTTWTYTEINASTFGINIADDDGNAHELGVDAVYITVHYTEAGVVSAAQFISIGGQ